MNWRALERMLTIVKCGNPPLEGFEILVTITAKHAYGTYINLHLHHLKDLTSLYIVLLIFIQNIEISQRSSSRVAGAAVDYHHLLDVYSTGNFI